jgi:T4 RnlA family RNA ligase
MFPKIKTLDDFLPYIQGNPQFRVDHRADGFTIVCYMVKDEDTFTGENQDWYKECRGITFDSTGRIVSRTLHKFPNVGETEDDQPEQIPWHDIVRIMDKRDGSMITFVETDKGVRAKTKKTFDSAEAIEATYLLHSVNTGQYGLEWVKKVLRAGYTPTFEFTSPRFPIVLVYDRDELTLLQIRENVTGRYIMPNTEEWDQLMVDCPFNVVENLVEQFSWVREDEGIPKTVEVQWDKLKAAAETCTGIEGLIIQASDGRMWKVKTLWYCNLHHAVTFVRWRDVAKLVLADQTDDLKGAFTLTGRDIEPINQVQHQIFSKIEECRKEVNDIVEQARLDGLSSYKEFALKFGTHKWFKQIMTMVRGGDFDWLYWYKKEHLRSHSLEVIPCAGMDDYVPPGDDAG